MICRFNGHSAFFYSVAQHCISIANELKNLNCSHKIQLYGLLHDASEAYICDLPKPIKLHMREYRKMESRIQDMVWQAFNVTRPKAWEYKIVKTLDSSMMRVEAEKLMKNMDTQYLPISNLNTEVAYVPSEIIEKEFTEICKELLNKTVGV